MLLHFLYINENLFFTRIITNFTNIFIYFDCRNLFNHQPWRTHSTLNSVCVGCVHEFDGRLFERCLLIIKETMTNSINEDLMKSWCFSKNKVRRGNHNLVPKRQCLWITSSIFSLLFIYQVFLPFLMSPSQR